VNHPSVKSGFHIEHSLLEKSVFLQTAFLLGANAAAECVDSNDHLPFELLSVLRIIQNLFCLCCISGMEKPEQQDIC
jgi:hypothetical protein